MVVSLIDFLVVSLIDSLAVFLIDFLVVFSINCLVVSLIDTGCIENTTRERQPGTLRLFFPGCIFLVVLFWLYYFGCIILVVFSWLYYPGCIFLVVFRCQEIRKYFFICLEVRGQPTD